MVFNLTYGLPGRGAFPNNGLGGTLNFGGTAPGPYYRAPGNSVMKMPGLTAALAVRNPNASCTINDYAVYSAVKVLQRIFKATPDGILGPQTSQSIRNYQVAQKIAVDGVVGPQTCRSLFTPWVTDAVMALDASHVDILRGVVIGTLTIEGGWDLGAVGRSTPEDLGIGQINAVHSANPASAEYISLDDRLDAAKAIPWIVKFIDGNLKAMGYALDPGILAYNLGIGGARAWVKAGYPNIWNGVDVCAYINKIKAAMT